MQALAGQVLVKGDGSGTVDALDATKYHLGTATCMHIMQQSRLEIQNATKSCARHMSIPRAVNQNPLKHIVGTKNHGLVLNMNHTWDGKIPIFIISGMFNSDNIADTDGW